MNKSILLRKSVSIVMITVLAAGAFLLSGCKKEPEMPYGVWHSEDPNFTLYIDPNVDLAKSYYTGVLVWYGEAVDVYLNIDNRKGMMEVYDYSSMYKNGGNSDDYPYCIFSGTIFLYDDDKLVYLILDSWAETTGYKKIIFDLVDTYDISESF